MVIQTYVRPGGPPVKALDTVHHSLKRPGGVPCSGSETPTATRRCWSRTAAGSGARFMGLVHHTDAVREWAYDRNSPVGRLDKAWDEAVRRGRTVCA